MVDSVIPNDPNKLQPIQLNPIERQAFEQQSQEQRWMEFNQQVIPTTFQEMLSSSFDMAYQHGLGMKTYNLATRLTSDAPKVPAKELNERYKTDMFKYDVSEEQANDLLALVKRKAELGRIIESGDGSFWGDKVPWFAGSMAGWFVDPTSIPTMIAGNAAGSYATKLAAQIGTTAVKAKIAGYATESIATGLLQATGSQALAPEALEERSAKQFAIDMGTGMVGDAVFLGLGAAGKRMLKAMGKAIPSEGPLGDKVKTMPKEKASNAQAYAQEAFASGKKIDAEKILNTPEVKVPDSAKAEMPNDVVYVKQTNDGEIIASEVAGKKGVEVTSNIDDVASGNGKAIAINFPDADAVIDAKTNGAILVARYNEFLREKLIPLTTENTTVTSRPRIPDEDDTINVYHSTDANFLDFSPETRGHLVSFHDIKKKAEMYGREHIHQRQIQKSRTVDLTSELDTGRINEDGSITLYDTSETKQGIIDILLDADPDEIEILSSDAFSSGYLLRDLLRWYDSGSTSPIPDLAGMLSYVKSKDFMYYLLGNIDAFDRVKIHISKLFDAAETATKLSENASNKPIFIENAIFAELDRQMHKLDTSTISPSILNEVRVKTYEIANAYAGLVDSTYKDGKDTIIGTIMSLLIHYYEITKSDTAKKISSLLSANDMDAIRIRHGGATGNHYMLSEVGLSPTVNSVNKEEVLTKYGQFMDVLSDLLDTQLDGHTIAKVMQARDPHLYNEYLTYLSDRGIKGIDFGDKKVVLDPEYLPSEEVQIDSTKLEPTGNKAELSSKLTSEEMDMEFSKEALDSVGKANEAMGPEVSRNFDEEATGLLNELSTNEGESSIIKQDVETLKEEMKVHSHVETAIKAFVSCVLKG